MMRVFLVDDEQDLVWATVKRASRERDDLAFEGFVDAEKALAEIRSQPPDVLVTDLRMPKLSGFDLLLAAREVAPALPVVLITAYGSPAVRQEVARRGSVAYLEKPFSIDQLLESLDKLVHQQTGFSGAVAQLSFVDLVQIQALARFSGALEVTSAGNQAHLYFVDGDILHAQFGDLEGPDVVRTVVGWEGGSFLLAPGESTNLRTIREGWQSLLMDACRVFDETSEHAPITSEVDGYDDIAVLDLGAIGSVADDAPAQPITVDLGLDELLLDDLTIEDADEDEDEDEDIDSAATGRVLIGAVSNEADHAGDRTTGPTPGPQHRERKMGNVKESLESLDELDGYMGSCVVDSNSGMMLGSHGGGVNLEVAAAGNTEVVRAKLKTMNALGLTDVIEDILITLGKQYHIIRPLTSREGLFIYCVLDKSKSNLAMSRFQLADVEKQLVV